jgi:nucleoside-diphosphate-sugar epimerase
MKKTISILGCGWLGFPLAVELIKQKYIVKGSTTTKEKLSLFKATGIEPFYINISDKVHAANASNFFQSQVLVITLPFRKDLPHPKVYKDQVDSIIEYVETSQIDFVIFTSSTSIYPKDLKEAKEDTFFIPDNERSKQLFDIEQSLLKNKNFKSTIIRFAGLYGASRQVGRFLSSKGPLSGAREPVNLIHLDDCVQILMAIIEKDIRGEIFNAVSDEHPTREELYTRAAKKQGWPLPVFNSEDRGQEKIVSNEKLKAFLNYRFKYPNPIESL